MTTSDTRTMRERMLAGDLYIADDPDLEEASYVARERMAAYNSAPDRDKDGKRALLEELIGEVGDDTFIRSPLYVDYGTHITIGAGRSPTTAWSRSTSRRSPSATTCRSARTCSC